MSRAIERARPDFRTSVRRAGHVLWDVFWAPYWLGSTLPPPGLPGRRERATIGGGRMPLLLRQLDDLRATIRRQRLAIVGFRSLWLALLVLDVWLVVRVLARRELAWWPFVLVALLIVGLGALLMTLARPSRGQLARTLDRSYGLRERVATALEGTQGRERLGGVRALQVLEAMRVTRTVSTASAFRPRLPLREIALSIVAGACGLALLVLLWQQAQPPTTAANGVPGARPTGPGAGQQAGGAQPGGAQPNGQAGQQGQQGQPGQQGQAGQQPGQGGQPSARGQQDLDTLGGALKDHAATRQAADTLASGDNAGAAQALREAGASASQLSPDARSGLATDLREAAGRVNDPKLAQDLRDLADKLGQPNASGAAGAFDKVAGDVDRIAQGQQPAGDQNGQPGSQGQPGAQGGAQPGAGSGSGSGGSPQLPSQQSPSQGQQPGQPTPLLGADGKPIELPKGNANGPQINTQNPNSRGNGQSDPNAAGAGGGQLRQGTVGDAGADPNQVPFNQRGAIQNYFTPPPQEER